MNLPVIDLRTHIYGYLLPNTSNDIDVDIARICKTFQMIDTNMGNISNRVDSVLDSIDSKLQLFYNGLWFSLPQRYLTDGDTFVINGTLDQGLWAPPNTPNIVFLFTEDTQDTISTDYFFILNNTSDYSIKIQKQLNADLDDSSVTEIVASGEIVLVSSLDGLTLRVNRTNLISPFCRSNVSSIDNLTDFRAVNELGIFDYSTNSAVIALYDSGGSLARKYSKHWFTNFTDTYQNQQISLNGVGLYSSTEQLDSNLMDLRTRSLLTSNAYIGTIPVSGQPYTDEMRVWATHRQYGILYSYQQIHAANRNDSTLLNSPDIYANYIRVRKGIQIDAGFEGLTTGRINTTNIQSSANGTAANANINLNNNVYLSHYYNSTGYRLLVHNGSGTKLDIEAAKFQGTAVLAQYGDLAEQYKVAKENDAGTVLTICTCSCENEMKATTSRWQYVSGVVSTKPGLVINYHDKKSEMKKYKDVALTGRVPVKVVGKAKKGWFISPSSIEGVARATKFKRFNSFGRVLENKEDKTISKIECFITL